MKKLFDIFLCAIIAILAFFSSLNAQNLDIDDAYRSDVFNAGSSPTVEILTSGGAILTEGRSESEVSVYMIVKRGNRTLDPSDTDLDDYDIEIRKDGDRVIARAERKGGGGVMGWFGSGSRISISFVVYAPEASTIDGQTSGGSVSAYNFSNDVNLRTSGGSVSAELIRGNADLRTSGGSVTIRDIQGAVSGRTSGGSIRADGVSGSADLRTSGGSIRLENISGALEARTSGGSIRAAISDFTDDVDLRTSGGSIRVEMPAIDNFELDLRGNRVNIELRNFTGSSDRDSVEGTIGNGGPKLSARTSGGNVTVDYY